MSTPSIKYRAHRDRLWPLMMVLTVPWVWAAFLMPWWVSLGAGLLVPLVALATIVYVFPSPVSPRRAGDNAGLTNEQIEKMRGASSGLPNLLGRWSSVSSDARVSLEEVQQHVDDVAAQTETAVVEITNSFIGITRKTRSQMDFALSLLQQTQSIDEQSGEAKEDRSLPQYIRASEAMLGSLTSHLQHFSEASLELVSRQERIREQARRIDDQLDQMASMAKQLGVLALNTSTIGEGSVKRDFVGMADKVRALSQTANDLTRDVRQSLEKIKEEISEAYAAIKNVAQEARATGEQVAGEVGQLSAGMLDKNRQVADILDRINAVGREIERDINQVIISMQFQDITRQKLQRLKDPVVKDVLDALNSLSAETHLAHQRLNTRMVDAPGVTSAAPFRVAKGGTTSTVATPEDKKIPAEHKRPAAPDDKVELF
jgi:methyl-accepting chemotaxis protein